MKRAHPGRLETGADEELRATMVFPPERQASVPVWQRWAENASDGVYRHSGGTTTLDVTRDGDTLRSTFSIAIQIA